MSSPGFGTGPLPTTTSRYFRPEPVVVHSTGGDVLEGVDLAPATEVVRLVAVLEVPVLEAVPVVVLLVADLEVPVLDVAAEVVLLVVVVDAPVFEVVAEVLLPVVFCTPVLAGGTEVFGVVVAGAAGACGESVCARRIAAETKLQTRMTIKRFMAHPFKKAVEGKVPRP
jgi:hypothetical protein